MLSTLPYGDTTFALALNDRTQGLTRRHFVNFGRDIGLPLSAVERALDKALAAAASIESDLEGGALPFSHRQTRDLVRVVRRRRRDMTAS